MAHMSLYIVDGWGLSYGAALMLTKVARTLPLACARIPPAAGSRRPDGLKRTASRAIRGDGGTNTEESSHSRLRRSEKGVHHRIPEKYLESYARKMALPPLYRGSGEAAGRNALEASPSSGRPTYDSSRGHHLTYSNPGGGAA